MFTVCGQTKMQNVCPLSILVAAHIPLLHTPHILGSRSPHQAISEHFPHKRLYGKTLYMTHTRYPHIHIPNNNNCF